ncbi:hypothetical protein [Lacipirellula sp.]|uniref:hypothetical protein n=1 Tax=Lacipirellula sp. TaxID=2691419 RepID=UPI003D0CEF03
MHSLPTETRAYCCRSGGDEEQQSSPLPRVAGANRWLGRGVELAGWLVPGTLLAFFPKCPLCVAGYVALATGLGLSLAAATYLRWGLLVLCVGSLALMAWRFVGRRVA